MMGQFLVVPQNYTGVNSNLELTKSLKIFPNPTSDYFTFELPNKTVYDLRIFDITGKLIKSINSETNTKVDVSSLAPSNYVVFVKTKDGFYSSKLLIQRN